MLILDSISPLKNLTLPAPISGLAGYLVVSKGYIKLEAVLRTPTRTSSI